MKSMQEFLDRNFQTAHTRQYSIDHASSFEYIPQESQRELKTIKSLLEGDGAG